MLPRSTTTHENRIYKAIFWARGYAVFTVGFEEEQIRRYIRSQEQLEIEGEDEDGEFSAVVRTITLAALGAAHNRQAPRFAGAS